VSLLSHCKLKNIKKSTLDSWAFRLELQLVSHDYTPGFVSHGQYEQLLFVLGQVPQKAPGRSCKEILTLFHDFPTNTVHNFKDMLHRLQFPYVYDNNKTLAQNRRDFQDFFFCLTNIRCAVVEGGHCCEAASRTLQGYQLGEHIPLEHNKELDVPESSTLFKHIQTQVYYSKNENKKLDETVLKYLQEISSKVASQKKPHCSTHLALFF